MMEIQYYWYIQNNFMELLRLATPEILVRVPCLGIPGFRTLHSNSNFLSGKFSEICPGLL